MITFHILIAFLLAHFVADFMLQTHKQATLKSTSVIYLTYHICTYTAAMTVFACFVFQDVHAIIGFALFTYVSHFITDFFTSKASGYFFRKQDYHNGFVIVGIDQVIHYICLFGSYLYLING